MIQKHRLIFSVTILIFILVSGCSQKDTGLVKNDEQPEVNEGQSEVIKGPDVVQQSGGSAMLIAECGDRAYITDTADFIVSGTVEKVETKWNENKTSINTYSEFSIKDYIKGWQIENNALTIVTPGGCVGDVCEAVEDMPIFHEQKNVVIYFQEYEGSFTIVCGNFGVEEIQETVVN